MGNQEELQAALQRVSGTRLDAQGAACVWAGIPVGSRDLLSALNIKAGTTGLELDAVLTLLGGDGGGAGGGDPQADRTKSAVSASTAHAEDYSDEFLLDELDAAWTAVSITPTFPYTMPGIRLAFDAQGDGLWRPAPADAEFEVVIEMDYLGGHTQSTVQTGGFIGIGILTTAGTGVGCSMVGNDPQLLSVHTVTTGSYGAHQQGLSLSTAHKVNKITFALHRNGNNYRNRWSNDGGATWSAYSSTYASAHAVNKIGVGRFFTNGSASDSIVTLRSFKVFTPSFA